MQRSDHGSSLDPHERRLGHGDGGGCAEGLAGQTSFSEEVAGANHRHHGGLSPWGDDGQLDATLLDIENRVGRITLPVDRLFLAILQCGLARANPGKELPQNRT